MFNIVEFTIWDTTTGEIYSTGSVAEGKAVLAEGYALHEGEQVNYETHIFDTATGLPILRTTPPPLSVEEYSVLINRERQRRIEVGKDFDGVWLTGTESDKTTLLGLKDGARDLKEAGVTAAVIPYRDGVNAIHMLTPTQLIDLQRAGAGYVQDVMVASWALKAMPTNTDFRDGIYWP